MSAFQPVTAPFGLANTEDLMELYPDQGSRPTADDSIDIDLDLTTDPLENVDDDEMIEDPELSLDSTEYQDIEAEYDEQMVDEGEEHNVLQDATEDVYQEHDEDLDDVDDDELGNGLDVEAGVIDQPLELDQGRSSITPQDATQQAAQTEGHIGFLIQSDMEPDAHGAPEESQELVGQDQVHEPPVVQNSLLSSTDAQSPPQTAPKGNTYVSGDRIEEPTQTNQSSSDGHASGSQRLQGTVGPSQIIDPEDQLQPDPSETFTTGPLEVVSGSIEKIGSVAAEAHSTGVPYAGATVINNASPKRSTTEPSFIHEDVSTSSGIGQTDSKSPSTGVSHQHQRDAGAAVVPQADLEQEVEASQEASYLHAVVVSYQENEMFLFPPAAEDQDDNQTYCLTNETLAADPIQDLLKECRHVLEGSLNDQEELEIEIEDLGLKIGEVSDAATIKRRVHC